MPEAMLWVPSIVGRVLTFNLVLFVVLWAELPKVAEAGKDSVPIQFLPES